MSPDGPALSPSDLAPQDVVLRFLESTGRPSEARLYLDLFRARPREQFAALAIDANVMAGAADAVVQDLRFLAALDLFPTVVLGIFQPADAAAHARVLTPPPRGRGRRRRDPVRVGARARRPPHGLRPRRGACRPSSSSPPPASSPANGWRGSASSSASSRPASSCSSTAPAASARAASSSRS